MRKVGIIRCQQTEDFCPATTDFKMAAQGQGAFAETGPVEILGLVSCGGCPGKRAVMRAQIMVDRGAEMIAFASCMKRGTPFGFPCPHYRRIQEAVSGKLGPGITILDHTH